MSNLDLEDKKVYEYIVNNATKIPFIALLDNKIKAIQKFKPKNFEELLITYSLSIFENEKTLKSNFNEIKSILNKTYGLLIFQDKH